MKTIRFILIFTFLLASSSYIFSYQQDSLVLCAVKKSGKVFVFTNKIKVKLVDGKVFYGQPKILNDTSILINDTLINTQQIEYIKDISGWKAASFLITVIWESVYNINSISSIPSALIILLSIIPSLITYSLFYNKKFKAKKFKFKILPVDSINNSYFIGKILLTFSTALIFNAIATFLFHLAQEYTISFSGVLIMDSFIALSVFLFFKTFIINAKNIKLANNKIDKTFSIFLLILNTTITIYFIFLSILLSS